jgi:hypothetical protein
MQINKQLIAILILASLLFSAVGAALFFYKKNIQTQKDKSELVTVYIAKEDIPKDTLLTIEHLSQTKIAKQYILNDPLIKEEIIGKYTNEKIYTHEIFLKQKLDTEIKKEEKKILDFEKNAYNMKFELFRNPNYSIKQGEYVNIISVFPEGDVDNKGRYLDFDVQYVASNIKILGFIRDGRYESETITKHKIEKIENKKTIEKTVEVKADELMIDIDLDVLLELIKNYNKGTQLWMVKTKYKIESNEDIKEEIKVTKKDEKVEEKKIEVETKIAPLPLKYKYQMYQTEKTIVTKSAVIDYSNDKDNEKSITRNIEIVMDSNKLCSQIKDKFIVGLPTGFYIRSNPSKNSKERSILKKNTIIPYLDKQGEWYKTCDQKYIHTSVVKEIDSSFVKEKLGKYE